MSSRSIAIRGARLWRVEAAAAHRYGAHRVGRRSAVLLAIDAVDGLSGWAEAAPLPGFGGESAEACALALRAVLAPLAAIRLGDEPRALLAELRAEPFAALPLFARAAVENALADLAARRRGVPLARWLEPRAPASIAVSALAGDLADPRAAGRVGAAILRGVRAVKLKAIAAPWGPQRDALAALHAAWPDLSWRIDANGGWTAGELAARSRELAGLGVALIEQPLAADDARTLAIAAATSPVALAADESLADAAGREALRGTSLAFVLKPAVLGIASAWALATAHRGDSIASHFADGPLGRATAQQLAAALAARDPSIAHGVAGDELDGVAAGRLAAGGAAGFGPPPALDGAAALG